MLDISLYFIADVEQCGDRDILGIVAQAVEGGATVIQLRAQHLDDSSYSALAKRLVAALTPTKVPLLLNDRAHLVTAVGAAGVHIGEGRTSIDEARIAIGANRYLGASAIPVENINVTVDYLSVGPVWNTLSKADAGSAIGIVETSRRVRLSPWPSLAIGGITPENVHELEGTGISGAAVLGAICRAKNPKKTTAELKTALSKLIR